MEILRVDKLYKIYGKNATSVRALDDVSLSLETGEFVSIVGPSGSGKSTLLHMIGGVDTPTQGDILLEDENIYSLSDRELSKLRRDKIGLIYQFYNLIPTLNVRENIILPVELGKKKVDETYFNEIVNLLGLEERIKHLPNELSGGQQQRVAIARALICKPALLLADEPTGNLDSKNAQEIVELLKDINQKYKTTIIMVTHDLKLANYAKRIITMKDGKIDSDEVMDERVK
ncbi:MAG: ABC transporter ATP-binding protein [Bacilli bacterium]|nr:ABC transporter ATP-binding protein [Bacilli bacterium]